MNIEVYSQDYSVKLFETEDVDALRQYVIDSGVVDAPLKIIHGDRSWSGRVESDFLARYIEFFKRSLAEWGERDKS